MQANPEQGHAATGRDTTDLTADSVQQFTRTWWPPKVIGNYAGLFGWDR
ncbi:hypothetical protein AB0H20_01840 [Nocardia fluminea]